MQMESFDGYLPVEIWEEILAELPVKSLLRFRCVSKTWHEIIDSSDFISKHLIHSKSTITKKKNNRLENNHYYQISTFENPKFQSLKFATYRSDTFRRLSPVMRVGCSFEPCASVDGLILLSQFDRFRLWNPSIRKSLLFPPLQGSWKRHARYAVGFAPSSNEYKVVIFEFDSFPWNYGPSFSVYGLNKGVWRRSNKGMNSVKWQSCRISSECVSAKGTAHWLISFVRDGHYTHVFSFDFHAEEVSFLELPDGGKDMVSLHFLLEESIAVLGVSPVSTCIWIMDMQEGRRSWTKWYSVDTTITDEYTFFSEKQHEIRKVLHVKNDGVFLMIAGRELISYNIATHKICRLAKSIRCLAYIDTYVESLLLHKGLEAQTLTSFP